jgi:hypothetical protein
MPVLGRVRPGGLRPAEGDRLVAQPDLDAGTLGVAARLLGAGLADVDDRGALQVLRGDPYRSASRPPVRCVAETATAARRRSSAKARSSSRCWAAVSSIRGVTSAAGKTNGIWVELERTHVTHRSPPSRALTHGWIGRARRAGVQQFPELLQRRDRDDRRADGQGRAGRGSVIHAGRAPIVPSASSQNSTSPVLRGTPRLTRAIWPYRGCQR